LLDERRTQARAEGNDGLLQGTDAEELIYRALYQRGPHIEALREGLVNVAGTPVYAQGVMVLAVLGVLEPARTMLPALELNSSNPDIRVPLSVLRAFVSVADGAPEAATAEMDALLADLPAEEDLHIFRGLVRQQTGDLDGAAADFDQVIGLRASIGFGPVIPLARLALGQILAGRGDVDGARAQFDALLAQWADADMEFELKTIAETERAKIGG
jgi:tetratricopeptide (TPR) repeat protein